MPASGGPARRLTEGPGQDFGPTWSPDGERIAFERIEIYVVPTRGGEPRSIASDPDYLLEWPAWSPDGQWIAYQQRRGALWRVPSAGGAPERLTEGKGNRPRWSRDGKQLFYLVGAHFADRDAGGNVWSLTLEDSAERPVTHLEGKRGRIAGQSIATDGKSLYFIWGQSRSDIWVMDVVTDEDE